MHDLGLTPKPAGEPGRLDGSIVTDLGVAGMTCSHCIAAVTAELGAIEGVRGVAIELVAGGVSRVRVGSDVDLDPALFAAAVDEAGYELTDPAVPAGR